MIFSTYNTHHRCTVHDIERREQLNKVTRIDTETGRVVCQCDPLRFDEYGEPITYEIKFERIWPIYAGHTLPIMIQCSGRLSEDSHG